MSNCDATVSRVEKQPNEMNELYLCIECGVDVLFVIWTSVVSDVCAVYLHLLTLLLSAETSLLKPSEIFYIFMRLFRLRQIRIDCSLLGVVEVTVSIV